MWDEYHDSINGQLIRVTLNSVDDSGQQQLVSGTGIDGQVIGEAVRLQHFGATSVPPAGSEGLMLISGGRHDRAHFLGLEHPELRPTGLPSGAKAIYDSAGNIIKLIGTAVVMAFSALWTLTCKGGSITSNGQDFYLTVTGGNLYLGGAKGGSFSPVMTAAGPSKNVFAAI